MVRLKFGRTASSIKLHAGGNGGNTFASVYVEFVAAGVLPALQRKHGSVHAIGIVSSSLGSNSPVKGNEIVFFSLLRQLHNLTCESRMFNT